MRLHHDTVKDIASRIIIGSFFSLLAVNVLADFVHTGRITGLLMLKSIRTPLFVRDPYFLSDAARGITYVSHGLAGTGLVGLVIAHVYFAVRPEKWWITKSMILGWITRRQYLEHHEPSRWRVGSGSAKPAGRV